MLKKWLRWPRRRNKGIVKRAKYGRFFNKRVCIFAAMRAALALDFVASIYEQKGFVSAGYCDLGSGNIGDFCFSAISGF